MIIDSFSLSNIPFQKTHDRSPAPQMCRQFGTRNPDEILGDGIGVVGDQHPAVLPSDPAQIRNSSLHVEASTVGPDRFADRASPVVDTCDAHGQETGPIWRTMTGQAAQGKRLEFTFREGDRHTGVLHEQRIDARHEVEHVRAAGRTQVLLSRFKVAGGIVFEVRLVATQPILANMELAGTEIGYEDAGIIAGFSADDLATSERIDPSQTGSIGKFAVNPAGLQSRVVRCGEVRSNTPQME